MVTEPRRKAASQCARDEASHSACFEKAGLGRLGNQVVAARLGVKSQPWHRKHGISNALARAEVIPAIRAVVKI